MMLCRRCLGGFSFASRGRWETITIANKAMSLHFRTEPLHCGVRIAFIQGIVSRGASPFLRRVRFRSLTILDGQWAQKAGWQMRATRRQFIWSTLGATLASKFEAPRSATGQTEHEPQNNPNSAAYGSSHFGKWIEDEFGLPAFRYTCNQTTAPRATTPVQPGILASTEHVHQVGNDRITALAS